MRIRPTVLVVDDDAGPAIRLSRALRKMGCTVHMALHPEDALEILDLEAIDLLITDLEMPVMVGTDLARTAIGRDGALQVVFCSSVGASDTLHVQASSLGPVVSKNWSSRELEHVVAPIQERHRRGRACASRSRHRGPLPRRATTLTRRLARAATIP